MKIGRTAGLSLSDSDLFTKKNRPTTRFLTSPGVVGDVHSGESEIEITGLRNLCKQLDEFQEGLLDALLIRTDTGLIRKAGVMGIVKAGGEISVADEVEVCLPEEPHREFIPV